MPFIPMTDRIRGAVDPKTGSLMVINTGSQIEFAKVIFKSTSISLELSIEMVLKFPDKPAVFDGTRNCGIWIPAANLDRFFRARHLKDIESNTRFAEYLIRMIAFINKRDPLATLPLLWSDYDKIAATRPLLYRMPSDEELIRLSLDPE